MNGCAALSSLQGWCIYHARKPQKDREPGRKNIAGRKKENAHFYIRKIKSIPPQKQAPEGFEGTLAPVNFYKNVNMSCVNV